MKLHTVFITHNRLELTKRAIESYFETVTVRCSVVVVDNASTDGTAEWVQEQAAAGRFDALLLEENRYPGYACNRGFEMAPKGATHLHRADNDFIFLPGWCEEVKLRFTLVRLGQLGLRTDEEELHAGGNVGGNCIFSRKLWKKGLRWDERPWPQIRDEIGPGWTEDSLMSREVKEWGWSWTRVKRPCIQSISREEPEDEYYQQTWADRGIV